MGGSVADLLQTIEPRVFSEGGRPDFGLPASDLSQFILDSSLYVPIECVGRGLIPVGLAKAPRVVGNVTSEVGV